MPDISFAKKNELSIVQQLAHAIWPIVYKDIITEEQIVYMLDAFYQLPVLEAQFDEGQQFIIVRRGQEPIAFAAYGKIDSGDNTVVYKLHKIYVLPSQHGAGVGREMIEWIITEIKMQEASALQLNVNKNNPAIYFYKKLNFVISRQEVIDIGDGFVMDDYVMTRVL